MEPAAAGGGGVVKTAEAGARNLSRRLLMEKQVKLRLISCVASCYTCLLIVLMLFAK